MNRLTAWWQDCTDREKRLYGAAGALALVMTGGALAYATATGGAIVITKGGTMLAVGKVAQLIARG